MSSKFSLHSKTFAEKHDCYYAYLVTATPKYYNMDEEDIDNFESLYKGEARKELFERVFRTPGQKLTIKNHEFLLKGSIIGPLTTESYPIFESCLGHMSGYRDHHLSKDPNLFPIDSTLKPEITVSIKTQTVKKLKIT